WPRRRAGCRDERVHQPARRRRRGLPAARAHTRLPRQNEGEEPEDQCADGDRLQLGTACPARARSDEGQQGAGLGRDGEEEQGYLKTVASCQSPVPSEIRSYWKLATGNWKLH